MTNRRKFLVQGSLATSAILVAQPSKSLGKLHSWFPALMGNGNSVLLIHTDLVARQISDFKPEIQKIQVANKHAFWVHPAILENEPYKVVKSGNIKMGIISVGKDLKTLSKVSTTAAMLKKEKKCQLVVCVSALGYKGKKKDDDVKFANLSENIDVILGGHSSKHVRKQNVVLNRNREEVIINYTSQKGIPIAGIEIGFDNKGRKNHIAFKNKLIQSITA